MVSNLLMEVVSIIILNWVDIYLIKIKLGGHKGLFLLPRWFLDICFIHLGIGDSEFDGLHFL
jgi:hypothetical protein